MCGINGFIDYQRQSSREILIKGTDALSHRGPDDSGYEFLPNENYQAGLGHRRLSIIDLTKAGAQPMWYKNYCIVFNGEIYNHAEIRKELEELGHQFLSHSDTEVILHSWEEWKEKMLSKFRGMFAFVIYDREKEQLYAFRDRVGIKPFYYYWNDGLFLFSSELKSFHAHPYFKKEIDIQAVHQFLQYGYIIAPLCIFKNTFKLVPGHFIEFNLKKTVFKIKKYWDINDCFTKPKLSINFREAKKETERLLLEACRYRMVSDVPVGVFLSGGFDSTTVTALLQSQQKEKLKTFTIGFHENKFNEAPHAKKIANHLGTDHTEYYCTTKEAQQIVPQIPFICDEPSGDSSIIPTLLVSKIAREKVTVALSADGGDELFGGYNKYTLALDFLNKLDWVPFKKSTGKFIKQIPDSFISNPAFPVKKERIAKILSLPSISSSIVMDYMLSQTFSDEQMNSLIKEKIEKPYSFFGSQSDFGNEISLDNMLATDYKTYLPSDILYKVDLATMNASLEGREPLLDHTLIEFVGSLPADFKIKNGEKKYLLKQIAYKYVPKELLDRPKMGFGIPVFEWLKGDLRNFSEEYMSDKAFKKHGLFKPQAIENIKQNFFKGNKSYDFLYWYLLIFQMWYNKWMD